MKALYSLIFLLFPFCSGFGGSDVKDCFYSDLVGHIYSYKVVNNSGMWIIGMDGGDFANDFGTYGLLDGKEAVVFTCTGPKKDVSFYQLYAAGMYDPVWVEIYLNDENYTEIRLCSESDDEFSRIFFDENNWVREELSAERTQWTFTILPEHLLLPGME